MKLILNNPWYCRFLKPKVISKNDFFLYAKTVEVPFMYSRINIENIYLRARYFHVYSFLCCNCRDLFQTVSHHIPFDKPPISQLSISSVWRCPNFRLVYKVYRYIVWTDFSHAKTRTLSWKEWWSGCTSLCQSVPEPVPSSNKHRANSKTPRHEATHPKHSVQ